MPTARVGTKERPKEKEVRNSNIGLRHASVRDGSLKIANCVGEAYRVIGARRTIRKFQGTARGKRRSKNGA